MNKVEAYIERTSDNDATAKTVRNVKVYPHGVQVFFKDGRIRNYEVSAAKDKAGKWHDANDQNSSTFE